MRSVNEIREDLMYLWNYSEEELDSMLPSDMIEEYYSLVQDLEGKYSDPWDDLFLVDDEGRVHSRDVFDH